VEQQLASGRGDSTGVFRVERRWRYACTSCALVPLGIMSMPLAEGSGDPPPIETLADVLGEHVSNGRPDAVQHPHDVHFETFWRVTP
jgi:hypothetical protein